MRGFWTVAARAERAREERVGFAETALMVGLLVTAVAAGWLFIVDFFRGL